MNKKSNYKRSRKSPGQSRDRRETREIERVEKANDPAWYTVSGQMVKDAANLSFNNPSGIEYYLDQSTTGKFVNPGVMNLYMAPVAGYSEGLSSPINIAAKNIYSYVRHANSGHSNYDSPDLMLYIIAMANAYAFYGWMTRLYGTARVYAQHNRYFGANIVFASGVDATNIIANLANFRAYINQYAVKLSALSVPSTMSLFKRYMWMFSNLYLDENNTKGQLYMYQPAYLYVYNETSGGPGELVPTPLCLNATGNGATTNMTFGNIMAFGDTMLAALIGSEDINIMSGDILKAYGKENIWSLDLIPDDYAVAPIFSEEVLAQIHNTVFAGSAPLKDNTSSAAANRGWDSFKIVQDPNIGNGCLICQPLVTNGGNTMMNHVLDFWKQEVTPEDIMVATRNTICGRRNRTASAAWTLIEAFGSEIPMWASVITLNSAGAPVWSTYFGSDDISSISGMGTADVGISYVSKLNYFNEHPYLYLVKYTTTSPYCEADASSCIGEMSNFTIVDESDLEKMHLTAILSELAVPMLGNIVRK